MGMLWDIFCDIMDPMSFNAGDVRLPEKPSSPPLEFGRSAGYARALFGIEATNPYLLHPDMDREWHKGYRAGLIEGGKQLEHGPQITDMAGNPMPGYPWV